MILDTQNKATTFIFVSFFSQRLAETNLYVIDSSLNVSWVSQLWLLLLETSHYSLVYTIIKTFFFFLNVDVSEVLLVFGWSIQRTK
jgi:hypothetical protein